MRKIAIFASGSGTNAENIVKHFREKNCGIIVDIILSNKENAYVIERAKKLNVPYIIFNRDEFYNSEKIDNILIDRNIDLIVLAGFLWLIPSRLIKNFPDKIINIHPALLPKYGGKGMYGLNVHRKVLENNEQQSGITVHYVNENYDEGKIIFQKKVNIQGIKTAKELQERLHLLEYEYYPKVIEELLNTQM